ncbi:MAG: hypothetical protein JWO02_1821 [Solirubrobacterales bacterium]|nr:hypothetical protein [Solirubrobacterales bacterium]
MTTNITTDFTLELPVAAPAEQLHAAVARVEDWWTVSVDRSGAEFTARFDRNWTRLRVDGDRWTVIAQDTPALPIADEWVGDVLTFDVQDTSAGTSVLHFTHHGLLAQECASDCRPAWQRYITSLVALAETGQGSPWRPGQAPAGEDPGT